MFQSLLLWISHQSFHFVSFVTLLCLCFNPCCYGLVIRAFITSATVHPRIQFQSLLLWISHQSLSVRPQSPKMNAVSILVVMDQSSELNQLFYIIICRYGFNPCCYGLVIRARLHLLYPHQYLIVSILVVMDQSSELSFLFLMCVGVDVSILVVMDQSSEHGKYKVSTLTTNVVSILVVMDQSSEPSIILSFKKIRERFNPCCYGLVIRAHKSY